MDALADVSTAFGEFFSLSRKPSQFEAMGFLQGLVTVQDSVNEFRLATGLDKYDTDLLAKVRNYRNRIAAHPVITDKLDPPSSCMIHLDSFTEDGFSCVFYYAEKGKKSQTVIVNYKRLSFENFSELLVPWNEVLDTMVVANVKFANKFADRGWAQKVSLLEYHFGKIATYDEEESSNVCEFNIRSCKEILSEFHQGLSRDGIHGERSKYLLELIRNLDDYLDYVKGGDLEPRINRLLYDGLVAQKDSLLAGIKSLASM